MPLIKKTPVKTFIGFTPGADQSSFFRLWQLINLDGPLCPLPNASKSQMSGKLERMRRQQVHVDEIKRLCHVPIRE